MPQTVIEGPAGFCLKHPEETMIVIKKDGPRKGQVLGQCKKCLKDNWARRGSGARKNTGQAKPAKTSGKQVLILNFEACSDEDLWADLHQDAREEFRTPEMQALHLIRLQLRGKED